MVRCVGLPSGFTIGGFRIAIGASAILFLIITLPIWTGSNSFENLLFITLPPSLAYSILTPSPLQVREIEMKASFLDAKYRISGLL
jgi:hypothetical protein